MRAAPAALSLLAFLAAAAFASSAFDAATLAPRDVEVRLSGGAAAYLALAARAGGPHECFASTDAGGRVSLSFSLVAAPCATAGGGSGLNEGDASDPARETRYAFHDVLVVTNKGTRAILVWVNATTSSAGGSLVEAGKSDGRAPMTDAYYGATNATALQVAPGESLRVGVRLTVGTLAAGSPVQGAIEVEARRA